ncbi:RagB/SusD family nutrient uptake outer membrane protein [Flavihumibacter solisilvae]|uniref:Carbohydrate-binding protein SusD n=1 Tax=Flavihumibacter solisilvae TaxID=1349421 RepID=A0A0C1L964_9BACT|nr:RagB/SusD family nutrient uptake outer membrane protein [Flavihumibacter solisilvae]KIC96051.1 hypothetical protein OI18_02415 [Flavihumibacter solisilvae]
MLFNKSRIIGGVLSLTVAFTACEKRLDKSPFASVDADQALLTSSDVESALVGAYSRLGDAEVYGGDMFVYSELLGNDNEITWSGTFQGLTQIYNKQIPVNNDFVQDTWTESYEAINVANNVLNAIDKVVDAKKDKVAGEAKFIRAAVYFDLVRLYAKAWNDGNPSSNPGVPLVLKPTADLADAAKVSRNTVAEVYAQIITDLTEAEGQLSTGKTIFANRPSASALLARVYLQQGDYANAAAAADRAIKDGTNSLTGTYAEAFPVNYNAATVPVANTTEDVFAMQVNNTQGVNDFNTYFSPMGRGDITIDPSYFSQYEENDGRLEVYYADGGSIYTGKFDMVYGNVHILRLAEMFLIRAESNFRLGGDPIGGVAPHLDINRIRARAGLDPIDAADLTLDQILLERKLELAFEGNLLHDKKRLEIAVGPLSWNSSRLVLPIPEREIKVNGNLVQNEGY